MLAVLHHPRLGIRATPPTKHLLGPSQLQPLVCFSCAVVKLYLTSGFVCFLIDGCFLFFWRDKKLLGGACQKLAVDISGK